MNFPIIKVEPTNETKDLAVNLVNLLSFSLICLSVSILVQKKSKKF